MKTNQAAIDAADDAITLARAMAKIDTFDARQEVPVYVWNNLVAATDAGEPVTGKCLLQSVAQTFPALSFPEVREAILHELMRIDNFYGWRLADRLISEIEQLG